jgi:citrate lyase alpha subunit
VRTATEDGIHVAFHHFFSKLVTVMNNMITNAVLQGLMDGSIMLVGGIRFRDSHIRSIHGVVVRHSHGFLVLDLMRSRLTNDIEQRRER